MIKVQNIYYMLAYAYNNLNSRCEKKYSSEEFEYTEDLFAAILSDGIAKQLKQGLGREYVSQNEELTAPRGKIRLGETFKKQVNRSKTVVSEVDDFLENTLMNKILKTTLSLLLRSPNVRQVNKRKLKSILMHFSDVDQIDYKATRWSDLTYNRNNQSYRILMNICNLILDGMLIKENDGKYKLSEFIDDQKMSHLYEKFILAYFRRHYPGLDKIAPSHISWNTDEESSSLLPQMKSDVMLEYEGRTLIIDAKYYSSALQVSQYGKKTIHSANMYQIYSYVKNKDVNSDGSVSGLLLYAGTDQANPDMDCRIGGNKFSVKTLDLNSDFSEISSQLDNIVDQWLSENSLTCKKVS